MRDEKINDDEMINDKPAVATSDAQPGFDSSLIPHPSSLSDLRVLLWDVDGTLVRTVRRGVFLDYTRPALERVFGTAGRLAGLSVSRMTGLPIAAPGFRD